MSVVGQIGERKDRPPLVRYERRAIEDKAASLREGRYVAKDVDFALITPPYSRDVINMKADQWIEHISREATNGRVPSEWIDMYRRQYEAWRSGQEMPLNGVPIKGWAVLSPAQQENLIRLNIMTVEDLANINDEGLRHIGIGAVELKHKAQAWLKSVNESGKLVQENAALKIQVSNLESEVAALKGMVAKLSAKVQADSAPSRIDIDDILDDEDQQPAKKPRKS